MNARDFLKDPLVLLLIILGVVNFIVYTVMEDGTYEFALYTGIVYNAVVILSAIVLFYIFKFYGTRSREGTVWFFMGTSMLLFAIAELIWLYYTLQGWEAPFPSAADTFFLLGYIPLMAAVVWKWRFSKVERDIRKDITIIAIVLLFATPTILYLAIPVVQDQTYDDMSKAISIAYPLLDLIILGFALFIALYWGSTISKGWYIISAALIFMTVADIVFSSMEWQGVYLAKTELLYVVSYLLFALGGLYQKKLHESFM